MKLAALLCLLACISTSAQTASGKLTIEGLKPSPIIANLQQLTDQIGGRVPGTPAMERAIDWGVASFKTAGADSVHIEKFMIQASWAEGATTMSVVDPESFSVRLVSLGWAPALAPQHHVPIVDIGDATVEDFNKAGDISGKVLLVHSNEMHSWDDLFAEYLRAPGLVDRAVKGKALAIAFQSTRAYDLLYRHTNSSAGEIDRLPMVMVAREDAARMARLIAAGQKLYADLAIPNVIGGPIETANVVAELRGSEKPDEFVVLGAHLDSWELGTGALDNGCNAALVIDALRTIKAAGLRPKRSIRFILFSGEEEGLLGSHAYVLAHRNELDNAVGMVVFDSGSGPVTGFSLGGRKDVISAATELINPLKGLGVTDLTTDMSWGTDHFDFMLEGVPTFEASQQEANYLINYHAMSDTYDKVNIGQLKKHVVDAAVLTYGLADRADRVGPRWSRSQIDQAIHETHFDELMKTFGMWQDWESGKMGREK